MTEVLAGTTEVDGPTDGELIAAVRLGDVDSYGVLFDRHRTAALRLARQLVRGPDADDLVADAFLKVLGVLQRGGGPDEAFRAYLLTAIRRLHIDGIRAVQRTRPTDDEAELDRAVEFVDPSALTFDRGAAAQAFGSLPERWQLVLWHLDVEGHKPAEVAPLLGLSPNSVSALAYRAREGLRQAYLQQHLAPARSEACRTTIGLLGAHVRRGLSARDAGKVEAHLDGCARCTGLHLELREVNTGLAAILGPALLGPAAVGYLGSGVALGVGSVAIGGGTAIGMAASAQVLALEAARVVTVPARIVLGAGASAAQVAAVTTVAVAGATTAGVVATNELVSTPETVVTASPSPEVLPSPTPEATVAAEPTPEAAVEPTPEPTTEPTLGLEPRVRPTPEATEVPAAPALPVEEPFTPTDFGIGSITVDEDADSVTVGVRATTTGRAADRRLAVRFDFDRTTRFGGASAGWTCDVPSGERADVLICRTLVPAGSPAELTISVAGSLPSAYVTLTGDGDPDNRNDASRFTASSGLLGL